MFDDGVIALVVREITFLSVPKMCTYVIGEVSGLDVDDLLHRGWMRVVENKEVSETRVRSPPPTFRASGFLK